MSAITGDGVREVVGQMASLVHEARDAEPVAEGLVIHRPVPEGVRVERPRASIGWSGARRARRRASDLTNAEALARRPSAEAPGRRQGSRQAPAKATRCSSGRSASTTSPTNEHDRRQGRHVVAHRRCRVIDTAAIEKLCGEVAQLARRRPRRRRRELRRSVRGVAVPRAEGASDRHPDAASACRGRAEPPHAHLRRHPRDPRFGARRCCSFLTTSSSAASTSTRARRSAAARAGAVPIVNENDALADDEIRSATTIVSRPSLPIS